MHIARITIASLALCSFTTALPACFEFGESDRAVEENEEYVGWQDRGRNPGSGSFHESRGDGSWIYTLRYTDVILSPDGEYLLAMAPIPGPNQGYQKPGLMLIIQPLPDGTHSMLG